MRIYVALAVSLGLAALVMGVTTHFVRRSLPTWMIRHKLTCDGATYTVRVGAVYGRKWNPGGQGSEWAVFGPATAVYRREDTPGGPVINLELAPDVGPVKHYSGPIPAYLIPTNVGNLQTRRRKRLANSFLLAPPIFGAVGSVLAWMLTDGKAQDARTFAAMAGFIGGIFLLWLLLHVALVANAIRQTIRGSGSSGDGGTL